MGIEPEEKTFKNAIRYRLVLKRSKRKGDAFFEGDFDYKRHDGGIDCREESSVSTLMRANTAIEKGTLLQWGMLEGKL